MKKILILTIFLVNIFYGACFAQSEAAIPASISTPGELASWLSSEFSYRMEILDDWQKPGETVSSRTGDCEDFAMLAASFLSRQGIKNDLIIVRFRDLPMSHAICMWQEDDGTYSFISNRKMYCTRKGSIREAVERYYPDWESLLFTDKNRKMIRTVRRA